MTRGQALKDLVASQRGDQKRDRMLTRHRPATQKTTRYVDDQGVRVGEVPPAFVITEVWLRRYSTKGLAWTVKQKRLLGLKANPRKGWIGRVVGTTIPMATARAFEAAAPTGKPRKVWLAPDTPRVPVLRRHGVLDDAAALDADYRRAKE